MAPISFRVASARGLRGLTWPTVPLLVAFAVGACAPNVPPAPPPTQAAPETADPIEPPEELAVAADVEPVSVPMERPIADVPLSRPPGDVAIGLLAPLTGPWSAVGRGLLNAAQLALFDHAGETLWLVPRDTRGTEAGAVEAMRALAAERVDIVIGPLLAGSVRSAASVARPAGLSLIAFTNDRTVAGAGVYVMGFTPEAQVERVIDYAIARGHRRFAALVPDNSYGGVVASALHAAAQRRAASVVRIEHFVPGTTDTDDATVPVRNLVAAAALDESGAPTGFDALLIAAGGDTLRALALLFPYYDLDPEEVKFLGVQQWQDAAILGEPSLLDGWFAAPPEQAFGAFRERYRAAFGGEPPRLASLAYDAMALASVLAGASDDPDFSAPALTDPFGFTGTDGMFRFGADGMVERGLAVYRVADRSFAVIDQPPQAFAARAF